jgi:hypothetical protein
LINGVGCHRVPREKEIEREKEKEKERKQRGRDGEGSSDAGSYIRMAKKRRDEVAKV